MTLKQDECREAFEQILFYSNSESKVRDIAGKALAALEAKPAATPEEVLEAVAWAIAKVECQLEMAAVSDAERHRKLAEAAIAALERFTRARKA